MLSLHNIHRFTRINVHYLLVIGVTKFQRFHSKLQIFFTDTLDETPPIPLNEDFTLKFLKASFNISHQKKPDCKWLKRYDYDKS